MALAATDINIGSVYLWAFISSFSVDKELLKELDLPEGFAPISGIALGYSIDALDQDKKSNHTIKINTIK